MKADKSIALLQSRAPLSQSNAKDALDCALIFGAFEQSISLFFHDDAVWQLMTEQNPNLINVKDFLKTFAALEFYDIENIYICKSSLITRKLPHDFHIDNVRILNKAEFSETLLAHTVVFRF